MNRLLPITAFTLSAAMALSVPADAGRSAITTAQIAAAISRDGMAISAEQVVLLADVVAATDSPTLNVELIEPWGARRMKVRLDCEAGECVPFYVAVRLGPVDPAKPVPTVFERPLAAAHAQTALAVRTGSPATLLIDGGHVHIRLTVVCLENGAIGQTIRAESKDRRQTYTAQVAGDGLLRGAL